MNMMTPTIDTQPTAIEVLSRMKAAHALMGGVGRFALTYSVGEAVECYVTHWHRPPAHEFDECKAVSSGTVGQCLADMERFARRRAAVPAMAAE